MDRSTLADALRTARTADDLPRLFALLGYTPDNLPADQDARVVARWRGFQVLAVENAAPREAARSLAARLGGTAVRALVVALGQDDELVLAAPRFGGPGSTRLAVISRRAPTAVMLQQLEDLCPRPGDTGLAHALRLSDLLMSETAGERFFAAFRLILERMAASLDHRHPAADRRLVALIALTRVLFLYFVQAKGWLDERPDYLRSLLDDALGRGRHFHRGVLAPLFFGTLNRQPADRSRRIRLGAIPYLNGGLFEPHPVERRLARATFSNPLWRDAFDLVFERFRFCVREAAEVDTIAPDMLGRVFERVMDEDERHLTGTFYTPESVVREIVTTAIETALAGTNGITADAARRIVRNEATSAEDRRIGRRALRDLKLLDPAVGSGAFLLGALNTLTDLRLALLDEPGPGDRWVLRRQILRDNLFGVDLSPVAVRLAELRLWLAVVADDPTTDIHRVAPLPNLDGVVRQGDSLLDPLSAARALGAGSGFPRARLRTAHQARTGVFDARGAARRTSHQALRDAELALARDLMGRARQRLDALLRDLAAKARGRDLFGERVGLDSVEHRLFWALRRQRAALRQSVARVADGVVPFFAFEVHAPDAIAAGGFDVVVGNPPWVRAERLPPDQRRVLAERFSWWHATRGCGYAHQPDLAVAFLQRALELTAEGGAVGFLVPSKLASSGYGQVAREHLVRETTITHLHRVPEREATAFGATTYPLAVVLRKRRPPADHRVRLGFRSDQCVAQRGLQGVGPWILVPDPARGALAELRASGRPLGEIAQPALGIKTGADAVFVGVLRRLRNGLGVVEFGGRPVELEADLLRPAVRGRDVRPYRAAPSRVLLYAHHASGRPLPRLPPLAARYISAHASELHRRADQRDGPPWEVYRVRAALATHRVIWADIARRPVAVALDETEVPRALPLNTCYVAPAPDREAALVIAAILNSTWAAALAAVTADEARGGYLRINARVASTLPVPPHGVARTRLAELSADAHRFPPADLAALDDAVADALALSGPVRAALRAVATHRA